MIAFKDITLADKELIQSFTWDNPCGNCDLSFANLCSWSFLYQTKFAVQDGFLLLRFYMGDGLTYMLPVGTGDVKPVVEALIDDAGKQSAPFRMLGVCEAMQMNLEAVWPGRFVFTEDRDYFDYLYLRTDLATLAGKKYQPKRNHVNKFRKQYPDYEYLELSPELVPACLKLEETWCQANRCDEQQALWDERRSMTYALTHLQELGVTGGVLRVQGRIAAFTYGAPINRTTWDVCVEKADTSVEGSYAMINYEYANHIDPSYVYVNREEDLGLEGLRKAKLSYHPSFLLKKCIAEFRL